MEKIFWKPIWFDSLGAKCSCCLVKTPDVAILIDPGAAEMQPSYPLSWPMKLKYLLQARRAMQKASEHVDIVVITHYHYDHHSLLDTPGMNATKLYKGKTLWIKDPNQYINASQWERARLFLDQLCRKFGKVELEKIQTKPRVKKFSDPMLKLPLARKKDWGNYAKRKKELLAKGRKWFESISQKYWSSKSWIPELKFNELEVKFADGKQIKIGKTLIKFSEPLFHGLEFDRVGWIFSVSISYGKERFVHTSDLCGILIEDYAKALIKENPNVLVVDGPSTYLIPYMMNLINLNRSIENLCQVIKKVNPEVVILDHHLLRERRYRERLKKVYELAEEENKRVFTAAEYLGKKPLILKL
ncbi:MAG: MBL fold metallo-hydrolase [Candidatus Aenigmarchaeota archaeon]|nr:MBL fold metallo-hydrolase [Candidatus Aenigmarchaeota archaeon]